MMNLRIPYRRGFLGHPSNHRPLPGFILSTSYKDNYS